MTVRFWYNLVAKWPCKPTHSNWIYLSLAWQRQLWRPWKSGRILIKHLQAIPLGYLKHKSFWGMTNLASRRGTLEKPPKCFGPQLERFFASLWGLFLFQYTHGISTISPINLFPDPLGSYTGPCKDNNKFVIKKHCLCFSFPAFWNRLA